MIQNTLGQGALKEDQVLTTRGHKEDPVMDTWAGKGLLIKW